MYQLEEIEKRIKKIPKGKVFLLDTICKKYPTKDVRKVLSRLKKKNEIKRIVNGVYVRPNESRILKGQMRMPPVNEIIKAISKKTGEIISIYCAEAANYVGLSTQIQVREIYYTTGRSRTIKFNSKNRIKLVHISRNKLIMPGTIVCFVTTAIWYQGKNLLTPLAIKKIQQRLNKDEFAEVIRHIDKMPDWMREKFIEYQSMKRSDPRLVEGLSSYYQG